MSDITREYLDKKLNKLATKDDIKGVKSLVQTEARRLEVKIETEVAELARMTSSGFEEIKRELDVRKEVASLDRRTFRIEQALNIKN